MTPSNEIERSFLVVGGGSTFLPSKKGSNTSVTSVTLFLVGIKCKNKSNNIIKIVGPFLCSDGAEATVHFRV